VADARSIIAAPDAPLSAVVGFAPSPQAAVVAIARGEERP